MRGAFALIVGGGLLLGGTLPTQLPALAKPAGPVGPAGIRTVVYDGYEVSVPADWPVYRLDEEPQQCVRYDRHAVYLGVPTTSQYCPAWLIGRTETVSILPVADYGPSASTEQFTAAAEMLSRPRGVVLQDTSDHVLQVVPLADKSVTVTATYGGDLPLAERLLATLRPAPTGTPWTPSSTATAPSPATTTTVAATVSMPAVGAAGPAPATPAPGALKVSPSLPGQPQPTPWQTKVAPPGPVRPSRVAPELGFDTCAPPSQAALRAWRRVFRTVAVYIGGVNAACYDGNLSASWVRRAKSMGWSMLPTYVGPQAPCYGYGTLIRPGLAAREGTAAAEDAAWDAWRLGLPARSPIYYDMEAYSWRASSCTAAVIAFLGAWTREINAKGYISGVYSSLDASISDMQWAAKVNWRGFTPPQAVWYALWDGRREVSDARLRWPRRERSKQYLGPHNLTIGGITMNIDTDIVDGPTAR